MTHDDQFRVIAHRPLITLRKFLTAAALAGLALLAGCGGAESDSSPIVQTSEGAVRGVEKNGTSVFLGIRYAAPPVGDLRWKPPQPPAMRNDLQDAARYGNRCAQNFTLGVFAKPSYEEDCLFLNVFAPSGFSFGKKRPVMLWIHGGATRSGSGDDYDGSKLAKDGNTVVVTFNYRLNAFGFLAHPTLDAEGHAFGNYGIMDQQAALRWVQQNISAFGGDPENVTIFGESAGGQSVLANVASPTATGLFHRAIVHSGPILQPITVIHLDLAPARAQGEDFARAMGCPDQSAKCLRSLSVRDILDKGPVIGNQHIVDGTILPLQHATAFRTGQFNRVPMMIGANRDDWTWIRAFIESATGAPLTSAQYPNEIAATFGANASQVIARYPLSAYLSPSLAIAAAETDAGFTCSARRLLQWVSRYVPQTYAFQFADRTAPSYMPPVSFQLGAAHTFELQYLFPQFHGATGTPQNLNADQLRLSDQMVRYWTTFARQGNPNSESSPSWATYGEGSGDNWQSLHLPEPARLPQGEFAAEHKCDFWDGLYE